MLKLLLVREIKNDKQTHGRLFKIGKDDKREFLCYTLEDKERDVKIKGQTAIPKGKYTVIVTMSPKFKKELPLIMNVPNLAVCVFTVVTLKTIARAVHFWAWFDTWTQSLIVRLPLHWLPK